MLTEARFEEMPGMMRLMHAGLFFIRVCFLTAGVARYAAPYEQRS